MHFVPLSTGSTAANHAVPLTGSIPANPDAQNVPSFRRWRFEMKLSPFFTSSRRWGGRGRRISVMRPCCLSVLTRRSRSISWLQHHIFSRSCHSSLKKLSSSIHLYTHTTSNICIHTIALLQSALKLKLEAFTTMVYTSSVYNQMNMHQYLGQILGLKQFFQVRVWE